MIDLFYGEFLLHPSPLEISGDKCSHNCAYCFANIRCSDRVANVKSFVNSMTSIKDKTLSQRLFKEGYSICLSNRTDPFSKSNDVTTSTYLKYLVNKPNGLFIQTKGGQKYKSSVDFMKANGKDNVVSYFTVTSTNNDILKKVEPGAPTFEDRLDQIKYSVKNGYKVIVAFNPLCEEWMPKDEYNKIFNMFVDAGVNHFIYQRLHMNSSDIKRFSQDRLSRFGGELEKATKRKGNGQQYLQECLTDKLNSGVNVLAFGMPYKTDFFIDIRKQLGKCFPSNYDFINYCFERGVGNYTFDDFITSLGVKDDEVFNTEFNSLSAYILRVARNVWKGNKEAQNVKTLIDVLRIYFNDRRVSGSPQNNLLFKKVSEAKETTLYFDGDIHRGERTICLT